MQLYTTEIYIYKITWSKLRINNNTAINLFIPIIIVKGVLTMFSAILALLTLPYLDLSNLRGNPFKPLMKVSFLIFVANFFILMKLGSLHVEEPYGANFYRYLF